MNNKKLTDNEIIKALEDEIHLAEYVDSDYCSNVKLEIIKSALDLITRQQAEIEEFMKETAVTTLLDDAVVYTPTLEDYNKFKKMFKSEAYKEFVERLKEKSGKVEMVCSGAIVQRDYTISEKTLDNLVKERVGDDNA